MSNTTTSRSEPFNIGGITLRSALVHLVMYGAAFLFVVPYIYMISTSFMTQQDAVAQGMNWIPDPVTLGSYIQLFTGSQIIQWSINTLIISSLTTLLVLLVDSMIAFALTRLEWPGQRYLLALIIASFMVPGFVNIIPLYLVVSDLGLLNSYLAVILPFAAGPLGVFLLAQFFRDIPYELQEAAQLDGFSNFRIYTRMILPLSKSILTALALFIFVWSWNQFLWPLIVLQSEAAYTLPIGVVVLQDNFTYQPALTMASAVVASGPLFILFLLLQEQLMTAVEMQGVT
ncbi:carbohydrate ABC transporter permease [Candidatus Halobonum tyrrellensis]|uniref:ABC transporter integral membrane protein n=1 Tax=Candidatus Halobonum tyrrellensis G22 TaxID=1324957 RepID=V4HN80_9EURY|nr:carbohydrate ABC transporter permease [Candidatus Halobonum tyrrellensis]ESP89359.1 ABC transporter integral membrane protein [Candidatus Halobonum tyrrellensis G22]